MLTLEKRKRKKIIHAENPPDSRRIKMTIKKFFFTKMNKLY